MSDLSYNVKDVEGIVRPARSGAVCAMCGGMERVKTHSYILSHTMGGCAECFNRYGWDQVIKEANRQLSTQSAVRVNVESLRASAMEGKCFHCGEKVLRDLNGSNPMLCTDCQRELRERSF